MTSIVAPTDFSPTSLNAVNYAVQWAIAGNKSLWLIHVCELPIEVSEVPAPQFEIDRMLGDAEVQLKALKEKINDDTGGMLDVNTVIKTGNVVIQVERFCETVNTEAVVMGAETANAFIRLLAGGKTVDAVREMKWPLIIVPPGVTFHGIRNIGLACDFKKVEETIPLNEIRHLVQQFNAQLHVVHVSEEKADDLGKDLVIESMALQNRIAGLKPQYHFLESTDEDKSIIEFAEKNKIDLLIIIPKKHNFFSSIFRHSHSKDIVLHSLVPVMAMHE